VGIFAGLLTPPLAALLRDVVTPVVACLMTLVLLRVDPAQVLDYLRRPLLVLALLLWLLVACPVLAWGVCALLGFEGPLAAALVIMATGCAATSSPAFARLVGLDGEIALVAAVLSTLLIPFTAPPLALGLMGIDLAISLPGLMTRLALVVGLPLLLSIGLRRWLGPVRLAEWGRAVDGAVVLLVVLYGFGVMDGILPRLLAEPRFVLGGIALAFAGSLRAEPRDGGGLRALRQAGGALGRAAVGQPQHGALSGGAASGHRCAHPDVLRALPVPALPEPLPAQAGLCAADRVAETSVSPAEREASPIRPVPCLGMPMPRWQRSGCHRAGSRGRPFVHAPSATASHLRGG
jgi:BASS family bile acid:Na+ symporter